ncbi:MAG: PIN domain-containing protein [Pseudomonadota bacterium]|nr:PIN domain-containing protein [Pseudomonadota bacterium]
MTPDVNVLVAASRTDHPHHTAAHAWLQSVVSSQSLTLLPTVVASFLRLVTHPKVFAEPTPIDAALAFVEALRPAASPAGSRTCDEWPQLKDLCQRHQLRANDLPDAWIAAQVLARGLTLVTFDRDFVKLLPAERLTLLPV